MFQHVTGNTIDALKEDEYGFVDSEDFEEPSDIFNEEINMAAAVFPTTENITYSAIMHNFDKAKEKSVNKLILDVQNKATELTELV